MLVSLPNEPTKVRKKNWVEISDGSHGVYNIGSQIKLKTSMIRSSLCDYSDGYILVKITMTVRKTGTVEAPYNRNKKVMFKSCAPFADCISEINNK